MHGRIVFLNGTSSPGGSSIAKELPNVLDEPCFPLPVDSFHAMRSRRGIDADLLPDVLHRTWRGFHRAVAGVAAAGNNAVVDHVPSEEWRLLDDGAGALITDGRLTGAVARVPLARPYRVRAGEGDEAAGQALTCRPLRG
ncbi:chloramphenicol phosphotransferase [Streptomyces sp. Tu 3180]|uniref:phosphotransferase-like protein n=1 Tax=Streptomyces sp. Tu 3180 TaxID=2682611 RepID=UPI001358D389|nr:chloramphenicol phosphotransferase [Streptomyces sp. Tu 3180]KAF3468450.1 chloramphenicol phosphotransferase [Streptomyces sp. Tu 3180]